MQYEIRRLVIGSSATLRITEEEYQEIKKARAGLGVILSAEEKFSTIIDNYVELEEELLRESLRNMVFFEIDYIYLQALRSKISRRLINLLASTRLYVDGLARHTGDILEINQAAASKIKATPSTVYDQSLAYRVMEAIRNYAQHRELPVHTVTVGGKWEKDERGESRLAYSVVPKLNIRLLREDKKFKSNVLTELVAIGEQVEFMPFVREYIELLGSVHQQFRDFTKSYEDVWENTIQAVMIRYGEEFPKEGLTGLAAVAVEEDGKIFNTTSIFKQASEYRNYLKQKTRVTKNLSRRYVRW